MNRSISLFRTSYSFVSVSRDFSSSSSSSTSLSSSLALVFVSQHAPCFSSFTPLYVASEKVPPSHSRGSLFKFDSSVAFWNFLAVGNYAARFYKFAIVDVNSRILSLQDKMFAAVKETEQRILNKFGKDENVENNEEIVRELTKLTFSQAELITVSWRDFLFELVQRFHDGYTSSCAAPCSSPAITMKKMFYDKQWLQFSGFFNGKFIEGPGVLNSANPNILNNSNNISVNAVAMLLALSVVFSFALGHWLGLNYFDKKHNYLAIPNHEV